MIAAALAAKAIVIALAVLAAQACALALVPLALGRLVGKRLPPAWLAAAWMVVFVKLVLPWGPAMPWSISDLLASVFGSSAPAAAVIDPSIGGGIAPEPVADASPLWLAVAALWLAGAAALLVRAVAAHHRRRAAARALPLAPPAATSQLAQLAAQIGVRAPALAIGGADLGPHVVGTLVGTQPIIVVPPALAAEPALLRAALLHELAHIRRRDGIGRAIQLVACALFFWCPLVHVASRRLDLAREAACDAWALEIGELSRPAYARLLVAMAQLHATGLAMSAAHLDARVRAVLGPARRARLSIAHKLAIAAWAVVALGGARTAEARGADHPTCMFTPQLAAQLYISHPEADLDGDGALSRDEACELQAELRAMLDAGVVVATPADPMAAVEAERLVSEPLCCNCDEALGQPRATAPLGTPEL